MAKLDINGYTSTFRKFAEFAQQNWDAGNKKAIANVTVNKTQTGRHTYAVIASGTDKVYGALSRSSFEMRVNDATRDIFLRAVRDMFGKNPIPPSVVDALKLEDFDHGQPLTARRIIAVKQAIDASGIPRQRAADAKLAKFTSPEVKTAALQMGFAKAELPRLARAAHFYAQATGVDEMTAMRAVAEPNAKANRLMNYGGRFMESAENFREGLRLIDSFATWFRELGDAVIPIYDNPSRMNRDFTSLGNSVTKLNVDSSLLRPECLLGYERFVFEELSVSPGANLSETDPEKLFGFEHNAASRFVGRSFSESNHGTLTNIPPAKRAFLYEIFDLFTVQSKTPEEAHQAQIGNGSLREIDRGNHKIVVGRFLRHYDALEALRLQGKLTAKAVIDICFPDMRDKGNYDSKAIDKFLNHNSALLMRDAEEGNPYADLNSSLLAMVQEETGATLKEAAESLRSGKPLPPAKFMSPSSLPLSQMDGTTTGARESLEGDIDRPTPYRSAKTKQLHLPEGFGFTFPDGEHIVTNGAQEGLARIPTVCEKVEALCGRVHNRQAVAVLTMLSQSGTGILCGGLKPYGYISDEHAAVEFTLYRNAETGAVTIRYSSPAALPIRFTWTSTVDTDGNVATTPMVVEKPVQFDAPAAKKAISAAAKTLGFKLTGAQTQSAAAILLQHGQGLFPKNATYLAQFIARQTQLRSKHISDQVAAFLDQIKEWRDFDLGDGRLKAVGDSIAQGQNDYIEKNKNDDSAYNTHDGPFKDIFLTMVADSNRATYVFNGKTFKHGDGDSAAHQEAVIGEFKKVLPPKAYRAVSTMMQQSAPGDLIQMANQLPIPPPAGGVPKTMHDLPGAKMIAQRNAMAAVEAGLEMTTLYQNPHITYSLDVDDEKKTATVTITMEIGMNADVAPKNVDAGFGKIQLVQRSTVDLTADTPTVTQVELGQKLLV